MFSARHEKGAQEHEALQAQLYQPMGQLRLELDWLKKSWSGHLGFLHR